MVEKYKSKIQGLEKDLKEILKQESEEKEVRKHSVDDKALLEKLCLVGACTLRLLSSETQRASAI